MMIGDSNNKHSSRRQKSFTSLSFFYEEQISENYGLTNDAAKPVKRLFLFKIFNFFNYH